VVLSRLGELLAVERPCLDERGQHHGALAPQCGRPFASGKASPMARTVLLARPHSFIEALIGRPVQESVRSLPLDALPLDALPLDALPRQGVAVDA
jgi:hypothetical protein